MKNKILLLFLLLLFVFSGFAQNLPASWFELGLSKELVKNLQLEFNPELRMLEDFKMDSYILEGGFSYKLQKYLTIASYYRYENTWDYKNSTGAYKGQKYLHRLALEVKSGFDINRFDFQFRIRYTQGLYANNDASDFRYRAKVEYDIRKSKFVPYLSAEIFHDLSIPDITRDNISGGLKYVDKIRYTASLNYVINKNNDVGLFYRLQNNRIKEINTNIVGLSYDHDF